VEKKIDLGTAYSPDFEFEVDAYAFEDDHCVMIEFDGLGFLRVYPSDFPKVIALMAKTMDGMVDF
jgi:hypothetical protein